MPLIRSRHDRTTLRITSSKDPEQNKFHEHDFGFLYDSCKHLNIKIPEIFQEEHMNEQSVEPLEYSSLSSLKLSGGNEDGLPEIQ
ncbi:hypothetical protein NPIL_418381 [Nephila pilipes]|uniref:Uncharacterized protein n=1 Tax=Nephila pilipes TaxID=299642 RepID=A0A8X6MJL1_NEPPI|nr:hypothetical protein NPIL_418381 [Nephila pilipes]